MKKIYIVGGGITGLSIAHYLKDFDTHIFEKEKAVGGLCSSFNSGEFTFDLDAHFLHFRFPDIKEEILNTGGDILVSHKRSSWIYWDKNLIPFPFQNHLSYLSPSTSQKIFLDLLDCWSGKKKKSEYLDDFLLSHYGSTLYKEFFLPYILKFYRISPEKIPFGEIRKFFPKDNFSNILRGLLTKKVSYSGYNHIFYYPYSGGIKTFVEKWKEGLEDIIKEGEIKKIYWNKKEIEVNGKRVHYDFLIYTPPLPVFLKSLDPFPSSFSSLLPSLYSNSILCYNIGVSRDVFKKIHWIYFPENDIVFFRVGFYSHVSSSMAPSNCSSIYVEVSVSNPDKNLKEKVIEDLIKVKILKSKKDIKVIKPVYIPYAYPLFVGKRNEMEEFKNWLKEKNIFLGGRYAEWKYYSMEDCIRRGKEIAREIRNIK